MRVRMRPPAFPAKAGAPHGSHSLLVSNLPPLRGKSLPPTVIGGATALRKQRMRTEGGNSEPNPQSCFNALGAAFCLHP